MQPVQDKRQMSQPEKVGKTDEEWLLDSLQDPEIPIQSFISALKRLHGSVHLERAECGAELLLEVLISRGDESSTMALLGLMLEWRNDAPSFSTTCAKHLASLFRGDRQAIALISYAGFDSGLPPSECLRRFNLLRRLKPGVLCHEKSRGAGIVSRLDEYAHQVVIDFETKKNHRMDLAYASEALELPDEGHILSRWRRNRDEFFEWLSNDPAEAVLCALRSFGPMDSARLREVMVPLMPDRDSWKKFWERARRGLLSNPLVNFPESRSGKIRLLEGEKPTCDSRLEEFRSELDCKRILQMAEGISRMKYDETREDFADLRKKTSSALSDRLNFVIRENAERDRSLAAHALILARETGVEPLGSEARDFAADLPLDDCFLDAASGLPIRLIKHFFEFVENAAGGRATDLFTRLLPRMKPEVLGEMLAYLEDSGRLDNALEHMRSELEAGRASCEMLCWMLRDSRRNQKSRCGALGLLARHALSTLEQMEASGQKTKGWNQLRSILAQRPHIEPAMDSMETDERADFAMRIARSRVWPDFDREKILRIISGLRPELSAIVWPEKPDAERARTGSTSIRSFRERQALLRKIVAEDIPKNSNDIALARSFGDMRENFEYKAAKETQGILWKRKSELERQLAEIESTDFEQFRGPLAGPGTSVTVRDPDGRTETYNILGEWDFDERLGIIPSRCKVAKALSGCGAGDSVRLENGAVCAIVKVAPLPDEVRAWIRQEPAGKD